jgi:hypothetical protein
MIGPGVTGSGGKYLCLFRPELSLLCSGYSKPPSVDGALFQEMYRMIDPTLSIWPYADLHLRNLF